ncbi:hypothetical protein ES703_66989 [subsurface metagenome]
MGTKNREGLTIGQAAKALGVSTKTVRRKVLTGELPYKLIEGKYGQEYRITELPGHYTAPVTETVDAPLAQALDIISRLQAENRDLAGALGGAQEKIRHLEDQVLLITAGRKPWWRRLLRRRE